MIPSIASHCFGKSGSRPGDLLPPAAPFQPALDLVPLFRTLTSVLATLAAFLMVQTLAASDFTEVKSEPGISYRNERIPSEPWSIHVIKIDRSRKDLGFFSAHARDRVLGVSVLAQQAKAVPPEFGRAIAA